MITYKFNMCIFEQAGFRRFKKCYHYQEECPETHFGLRQTKANKNNEVDKTEKRNRKTLEERKKTGTNPI